MGCEVSKVSNNDVVPLATLRSDDPDNNDDHPSFQLHSDSTTSQFEKTILKHHNTARTNAGLKPLVYDKALEQKAKDWGIFLKEKESCNLRHPTKTQEEIDQYLPNNIGQNLYVGHGYPVSPADAASAVTGWYNECKDYIPPKKGQNVPQNFEAVGHFTQLMWKDAKKLGCAIIDCPKEMTANNNTKVQAKGAIIACNYDRGNIGGQFSELVPMNVTCPLKL